ncbi:MAG TPA: DUF3303 family protein [Acidimicrobiales bacterium]
MFKAITLYHYKPGMTKDDMKHLLEVWSKLGEAPGVIEHFEFVDGTGGFTIGEYEDPFVFYRYLLPFEEFMTFETKWIFTVDEAAKAAFEFVGV